MAGEAGGHQRSTTKRVGPTSIVAAAELVPAVGTTSELLSVTTPITQSAFYGRFELSNFYM